MNSLKRHQLRRNVVCTAQLFYTKRIYFQILGDYERKRKYDADSSQGMYRNIRYENNYRANRAYNASPGASGSVVWFRRAGWAMLVVVPTTVLFSVLSGVTDQLWDNFNRGKGIPRVY
jgi:hypothetical protein